jgi:hypothetical protein
MKTSVLNPLFAIACVAFLTVGCDSLMPGKKKAYADISEKASFGRNMHYTYYISEMNDSIARRYKSLGVTSVQSYVTWETCEKGGEGKWDWSKWDSVVSILKENNLKWVPFLILGPAYSTPGWFRAGKEHFPCCCLEHGQDSKIESLWNPYLSKWIDRFIEAFSVRYRDSGVIESVLLGIQGDFGEAIYSVFGGGWTFNIPGVYHNHPGYWCDDPYALDDFRDFSKQRYVSLDKLNGAWGTVFSNFNAIDFPGRKDELARFQKVVQSGAPMARRRWIDFIDWYRASMTDWADWWIGTTRKYFPDMPIYLCTGGDARPWHGSNFAEQTRVAAKHGAGIRITNEASDYKTNFSYTAWVASAGKHYNTYYGFEPAGEENEKGIIARIYNATATGANQLFDYPGNIFSSPSRIDVQQKHLKFLFHVDAPIVPVALWYPNVSLTLKWGGYLERSAHFRDLADFDFMDETMLGTGALDRHKILVIIQGEIMETSDAIRIADWIKKGGQAIVMDVPKFESVEATPEPEHILFGNKESNDWMNGKGRIRRVSDWEGLADMLNKTISDLGLPVCDLKNDSIFTTQIEKDRWYFLNTSNNSSVITILNQDSTYNASINPNTITEVDLSRISK